MSIVHNNRTIDCYCRFYAVWHTCYATYIVAYRRCPLSKANIVVEPRGMVCFISYITCNFSRWFDLHNCRTHLAIAIFFRFSTDRGSIDGARRRWCQSMKGQRKADLASALWQKKKKSEKSSFLDDQRKIIIQFNYRNRLFTLTNNKHADAIPFVSLQIKLNDKTSTSHRWVDQRKLILNISTGKYQNVSITDTAEIIRLLVLVRSEYPLSIEHPTKTNGFVDDLTKIKLSFECPNSTDKFTLL